MLAQYFSLLLLFFFFIHYGSTATDRVICYYTTWSIYRPANGNFNATYIDPTLCTHLNYGYYGITYGGYVELVDIEGDLWLGNIVDFRGAKKINPDVKLLISIGGNNPSVDASILSLVFSDDDKRAEFVFTSGEFIPMYGYDGLDIAWTYPEAKDREYFVTVLRELKESFEPYGYILTITASAMPTDAYDVPAISEIVDMINLINYDVHTAADGVTGPNSPLYSDDGVNINASINAWINAGADPAKLNIGIDFYGQTFTLTDPSNNGLGAPVNGVGNVGPYTKTLGAMGYNEICETTTNWTRVFDDQHQMPYKYADDQWISYDDEESVALKVQFAKDNNIGGIMVRALDVDDFRGICGTKYGLLEVINATLQDSEGNV